MKFSRAKAVAVSLCLPIFLFAASSAAAKKPRLERLDGTLTGHAVSAPVSIIYDQVGMPHIRAQNDPDLFYGLGYAMAQDRFFFMDLIRRVGRGELSGLFGKLPHYQHFDTVVIDRTMRSFRFVERGQQGVANLSPEDRGLLEAYTRGINRYLQDAGDSLAEYRFFHARPEPWRTEDCFVAADLFGLTMTAYGLVYEYYASRLFQELGPERAKLFLIGYPKDAPSITEDYPAKAALNNPALEPLFNLFAQLGPLLNGLGSNNWVVSGSKTASGKPLLANDPHVPIILLPTFWYHAHLQGGDYDVAGMVFPGFPAFGAGSNGKIAWGITNARADYFDLFREKISPDHPGQYFYKGEWRPFEIIPGEIPVRGHKPVKYEMRFTVHGPVLEEQLLGYQVPVNTGEEVLVSHITEVDMARFFHGYNRIALAADWDSWVKALEDKAMGPVAWNHVFASKSGDIGYYESGHVALRPDRQGVLARRGTGEDDWGPWIPFNEMPHIKNPAKGFIATANNKIEGPDYPYYLSAGYNFPSRASRITELLEGRTGLTVQDMEKIQGDLKVKSAEQVVPLILADLAADPDPEVQKGAAALKQWQEQGYFAAIDATGPAVYEMMLKQLLKDTFSDELSPGLVGKLGLAGMSFPTLMKILPEPDNIWFDNVTTPRRETRKDIMRQAMLESTAYLKQKLGRDASRWTWGRLQTLYLYLPGGFIPQAGKSMRIGKYQYPGTEETINNSTNIFIKRYGFVNMAGPSSRLVVDLNDPRHLLYNCSTGPSENPKSGRFSETTEAWRTGKYFTMSMDEAEYAQDKMGELKLMP
jgi:penicillin amidase